MSSALDIPPSDPVKVKSAVQSLSSVLTTVPCSLSSSPNPASTLLNDPDIYAQISALLRNPSSGIDDNKLCGWLYDTFQSSDPSLQLVVLRFIPTIPGIYLSRVPLRKTLIDFEAVLLTVSAHETTARNSQLVVLRVIPTIKGTYLSRVPLRKTLTGFEAVLLTVYAHETTARNGQSITVKIHDLSHPSIYRDSKSQSKTSP